MDVTVSINVGNIDSLGKIISGLKEIQKENPDLVIHIEAKIS